MKNIRIGLVLCLAILLPSAALAADAVTGNNVTLAKGDNRVGTYYVAGQVLTVDGDVDGDVVCAGQTVTINGNVKGDVLCAAQSLTINGPVDGSVRAVGQLVNVNGAVGRNITVGGQNFTLGGNAKVGGEVTVGADSAVMNGEIARDIYVGATSFELGAATGGNVNAYIEKLNFGEKASVGGKFDYTSNQTFALDKTKVKGQVSRHAPVTKTASPRTVLAARLASLVYWIAAGLVIVLAAIWLTPRLVRSVTATMLERPSATLGWGALGLLAVPILAFVLLFTVIGIPLSMLLGLIWGLSLAVSGIFAGVATGQLVLGRKEASPRFMALAALAGVPLVLIIIWLPYIGGLAGFAAAAWTLGGIMLSLNQARTLG